MQSAQLRPQQMRKGDRPVHHAHAHIAAAPGRVRIAVDDDQALALARQRARADHHLTPELAAFPVAVIGGVVAKAQEDGQRQADQRERDGRHRDLHVEQVAMHQSDDGGEHDVHEQRDLDTLEHRAPQNQKQPEAGGAITDDHGDIARYKPLFDHILSKSIGCGRAQMKKKRPEGRPVSRPTAGHSGLARRRRAMPQPMMPIRPDIRIRPHSESVGMEAGPAGDAITTGDAATWLLAGVTSLSAPVVTCTLEVPGAVGVPETGQTTVSPAATASPWAQSTPFTLHWPTVTPGGRPVTPQIALFAVAAPWLVQENEAVGG